MGMELRYPGHAAACTHPNPIDISFYLIGASLVMGDRKQWRRDRELTAARKTNELGQKEVTVLHFSITPPVNQTELLAARVGGASG